MSAIKKSISMPEEMLSAAEDRAQRLGYPTLSQYLQHLIRQDLLHRGDHVRLQEAPPASSGATGTGRKLIAHEAEKVLYRVRRKKSGESKEKPSRNQQS